MSESIADGLLQKYGFNVFMAMHIHRYSKEKNIEVREIIQRFKDNSIPLKAVAYWGFGGYEHFKRIMAILEGSGGTEK